MSALGGGGGYVIGLLDFLTEEKKPLTLFYISIEQDM